MTLALRERGWETVVLAGGATADALRHFAAEGLEVDAYGSEDMQYSLDPALADWLRPRLEHTRIVHAHMVGGWVAAARAAPAPAALLVSEHNAVRFPGGTTPWDELREPARRVDRFFAHGPAAREFALRAGVPPERLRPGTSPISTAQPQPPAGEPGGHVAFVGRLHHEKGPDLLVEAAALLRDCRPRVLLVGSGPLERRLAGRARELGVEDRVRVVGWQPRPEDWLARAGACAVPSRHEAWSQAAVLAMRLRVPVVATAVEGLPEISADGRAILVAPEDPAALAAAIDDVLVGRRVPDLDAAEAYAARFTPALVAERYEREYLDAARAGS